MHTHRVVPLFVLTLLGCGGGVAVASDVESTADRLIGPFTRLVVHDGLRAELALGPRTVGVTGDDHFLSHVSTHVDGQVLVVEVEPGWVLLGPTPTVRITNDALESIEATGGSRVEGGAGTANEWSLIASGGSTLKVRGLSAPKLFVDASGGSNLSAGGSASEVRAVASGGAHVDTYGVAADEVNIAGSGGSTWSVRAFRAARGSLTGASMAVVFGLPSIRDITTNGGSEVTYFTDLGDSRPGGPPATNAN